jgi:hypothetical protein
MKKAIVLCACLSLAIAASPMAAFAVVLNELFISHTSTDTQEFIELCGTPGEDLSNLWLVIIEGEGTGQGLCDDAVDIATSFPTLPADGRLVIGNAAVPNVDLIITGASDLFENGTETVLLVSSATPIVQGTDVDTNNDGVADVSLGTIVDGVGLVDTGYPATDFIYYSQPIVGPDGSNFPAGVQRCEDCTGPLTRLMCFTMTGCAEPYSDWSPGAANNCPPPPSEACCFADGGCVDVPAADCTAQGGTPQGAGTSCGTVVCPIPVEACCFFDGTCSDLTATDCVNAGGTPQGFGTACATTTCPDLRPREACCNPVDGSCVDALLGQCPQGTVPQGEGTSCATTVCPPPPVLGACCFPTSCVDGTLEGECVGAGGTWYPNQTCDQITCVNATESKSWGQVKGQYR